MGLALIVVAPGGAIAVAVSSNFSIVGVVAVVVGVAVTVGVAVAVKVIVVAEVVK